MHMTCHNNFKRVTSVITIFNFMHSSKMNMIMFMSEVLIDGSNKYNLVVGSVN